ncbi:MAG TPA: PRC-barrel domain-containing protein [Gaiellales bacterium]|jgi:hypothetical protein
MTTAEQLEQWRGRKVVDADGEDIGKLDDVYFAGDGEPVLARVSSGLLGRHHSLVPLVDSSVGRDYLRVAYRRDQLVQVDQGELADVVDPANAATIARAYGVALPDAERGYESSTRVEARRAQAAADAERAAALESQAQSLGDQADAARSRAAEADRAATDAERDAADAAQAAAEARRRASP